MMTMVAHWIERRILGGSLRIDYVARYCFMRCVDSLKTPGVQMEILLIAMT